MSTPFQFVTTEPLAPVPLPRGGRTLAARDFTLGMSKLAKKANEGDEEAGRELLRRCLPGITDEEIDDLTEIEAAQIVGHCARRLQQMAEFLGNAAGAAGVAPISSPSIPMTNTSTPSLVSPVPSPAAAAGMTTPTAPSTASSSLSIG